MAAGIVDDPFAYRPPGHRELLGREPPRLVDVGAALSYFTGDPVAARKHYQASIRAVAEARWLSSEPRSLPWWRSVDDDETALRTA